MISIMIGTPTLLPKKSDDGRIYLPHSFEPSDKDVICGWAKQNHLHPGNRRFRDLTELSAPLYDAAGNKQEKTQVIASLVQRIRRDSPVGGGFVKRDGATGLWYEIGDDKARDKVGHAIRRVIDEKKKKNQWSALVKLVLNGEQIAVEHSNNSKTHRGGSSDTKPPSRRLNLEGLSIPTKTKPLPQVAFSSNHPAQDIISKPPSTDSLQRSDLMQNNLNGVDIDNHQPIRSNPYITENTLRVVKYLNDGLGNLVWNGGGAANLNSAAIPGRPQSSGRQTSALHTLGSMLDQPPADLRKQLQGLSASHKLGTVTLPGKDDDTSMEPLFVATTLDPTPIGPHATVASNSPDKKDDAKTERTTRPPPS